MVVLMSAMRWLLSPTGTLLGGVVLLFGLWQVDRYSQRQKGAREALVRVEKATEAINEKARKARDAAGAPGAAVRVRTEYCRDC